MSFLSFSKSMHLPFHELSQQKVNVIMTIIMILFTQSTAVQHKYLSDELKLLCYNAVLSTDCRLQQMLTLIQSQVATTSDTTEVVTKNQKGALTSEHSTDLFSVHNFDVTIDLAFPSGE